MIWERLENRRPVTHSSHVRWVGRQRAHTARVARRTAARQARDFRDPHGLYTFCSVVMIVALLLVGAGLLWAVNR